MAEFNLVAGTDLPICRTCGVQYAAPRADCPICLDERQYVGWEGQRWTTLAHQIAPGMTLINAGTHFAGGTVLHWGDDPEKRGALFSGDIFMVVMDRRWVSFMYSIPNFIPERPRTIRRALALVEPFSFERVYGAFWGRVVTADGAAAVRRSADRYLRFALDDES